jgi:hypothetical protein
MAQTFKYTVVGDTQPAVKGNEALDASIKQVDTSSKQLETSLAKSGAALELSLQKQDAKIKAIGGSINILGGSVELVVGSLGLIGVDEKTIGEFQKAAVSAIAFADGAKRVFEGYKEITEAKKIFSAITKTETALESANTVATAANTTAQVTNTTATAAGTVATNTANTATKALNATILKNPYVLAAAAVAALVAGIYLLVKANEDEAKSLEEVNAAYDKRSGSYKEAIGLRNREAELQIQIEERELGAIAAAEKRIELSKDLALQARVDANIADEESAQSIIAQEKLVKSLEDELIRRQGLSDAKRKLNDLGGDEIKLEEKLKQSRKDLFFLNKIYLDAQLAVKQADENIAQAQLKLEEELTKKREADLQKLKENREKAEKAAEELAKRAVKQLEDQRQATEDLIELYTSEYPEKVSGGQFEFNTELDRTNFLLKEQLDVLFALNTEYEDLSEQLEVFTDDVGESFFSEDQLGVFKKLRDAQKTGLQLQLEDLENTYRSDLLLFTDNEEMKSQITEQYEADRAKTVRQYAVQNAQAVLGITSQFLNTIAQVNQASLELQLAQAAGNQAAINQINADALEQQKKLRIAQVLVTTAESVLNGFNATSTLPPPFNFIAGAALAAAYTALGAKSIQTINATTLEGGGGGGGFNNIPSGGGFSLPGGGGVSTTPSLGALLPGLGGGRIATPSIGTVEQEPIRAYVLAGDVSNGVQAGIALNNRRRLSGG